jgi:hypothetical protein
MNDKPADAGTARKAVPADEFQIVCDAFASLI